MHALAEATNFIQGRFRSFDTTALWVIMAISLAALGVAYVLRAGVLDGRDQRDLHAWDPRPAELVRTK